MSLKSTAKKILGPNGVERLRACRQSGKYAKALLMRNAHFIETDRPYRIYGQAGKHVFFGYYDLQQFNARHDLLLAHVVDEKAVACVDPAEICVIERESGNIRKIAQTYAWCWQQGSRLRWHPFEEAALLFNTVRDNEYRMEFWNADTGKKTGEWPFACYDIDPDFTYGLSLNFSRLQRLRPGYGYSALPDPTEGEAAPATDGIFRCDLAAGSRELIVSLHDLAARCEDMQGRDQHYINHISIAPNGKRFLFFHLWTKSAASPWKVELYVAAPDGSGLRRLEGSGEKISHYCWKNDTILLTTTSDGVYAEYDTETGKKTVLPVPQLCHNGHPTYFADQTTIVTDTYPLGKERQHLFLIGRDGAGYREIANLFSDPRLYGEKRCDLHPRLSTDERLLTIDTTCFDRRRCILEFDL